MAHLDRYVLAFLQLSAVILAAMLLVGLLVLSILAVMKRVARRGAVPSVWWLIGLRMLTGYRDAGASLGLWRIVPVSVQNFVAMVGTALGVWALVVVLSVMGGFDADLRSKIVKQSPHVSVELAEDARPEQALARVLGTKGVETAEPYLFGEVLLTSDTMMMPGTQVLGVGLHGVLARRWLEPFSDRVAIRSMQKPVMVLSDRELGFGVEAQRDGPREERGHGAMPPIPRAPPQRTPAGIVLGEELARTLGVGEGDEVTVVIPRGDVGPAGLRPRTRKFLVAGTFVTGLYQFDLKRAFLSLEDAERLFETTTPNRVAVFVSDFDELDSVAREIRREVRGLGRVTTVSETNRALFSALQLEKVVMFVVLGLVILVAAFNVFGSLLLVTIERSRDVAVLKSLGAEARAVGKVLLSIGTAIGGTGTLAGLLLGLLSCKYIEVVRIRLPSEYYLRFLPVQVQPIEVVLVALLALVATLVAALYPATSASRLVPAQGLRND